MNWKTHLEEGLKDPESLSYFLNAQQESEKELLKCGIISSSNLTSNSNKTYMMEVKV